MSLFYKTTSFVVNIMHKTYLLHLFLSFSRIYCFKSNNKSFNDTFRSRMSAVTSAVGFILIICSTTASEQLCMLCTALNSFVVALYNSFRTAIPYRMKSDYYVRFKTGFRFGFINVWILVWILYRLPLPDLTVN